MNVALKSGGVSARRFHPLLHDAVIAFRSARAVFVIGFAALCAAVPASTSVVSSVSVFNVNYTHNQLKYQLYAQGLENAVNLLCVLFGAALAVVLFRFLLDKPAATAFFSVGVSRVKLFGVRFGVAVACLAVGIGLPFAASFVLNGMALGIYDGFIYETLYVLAGYLLVALVSFCVSTIAMTFAGSLFEGILFTLALLCSVSVALWGIGVLAVRLLVGNAAGAQLYDQSIEVAPSFLSQFSWANPLAFFAEVGGEHQYFMLETTNFVPDLGSWTLLLGWLVAVVALAVCAAALFCRRRGEQADMAGESPVLSLVCVAVMGFAGFCGAMSLLESVDVLLALAVAFVAFLLVSLLLLMGPLRGRTPRKKSALCIAGELCVMLICVLVLSTGGLGFSSYIPDADEVESVEVSYNGSPSYLTEGFSGVSSTSSYYYTSYRSYSQESSIEIVRSIHEQLIESANEARETNFEDFQSTVVPYDVVIRYTLKDGSVCERYYSQATIGELSAMTTLDNDESSHELESAVITGDTEALTDEEYESLLQSPSYTAFRQGSIYAADGLLNRIVAVECSDEERAELLEAIAQDLSELTASERSLPSSATRVTLMFTISPAVDVSSFGFSFSNSVTYVTDAWTNTLEWIDDHGTLDELEDSAGAEVIESLTLQVDDPYASINEVTSPVSRYFMAYRTEESGNFWITQDYGSVMVIDSQEEIEELLPNLRTGCYMTGGYLVQAKLRGIDAYVYLYLPTELVPDFLQE